ncbi:hypothetical protein QBC44DRAFT_389562 [Cladorrhinum sp. PSN332]|nr:hypothetical protein QBC44DRAFT_389562 [Cladorrhinum sp. PSN332]
MADFANRDIYRCMAQKPQPAALSVLQPRATNVFTGLWRSIRQRDSLACCLCYVRDSAVLRDFERLSMLGRRERDRRVERMGWMHRFGWVMGASGEKRVGIDYPEGEQGFKLRTFGGVGLPSPSLVFFPPWHWEELPPSFQNFCG